VAWFYTLLIINGLLVLALLPTIIAVLRGAGGIWEMFVLNVLCALTGIGWIIALGFAFVWPKRPRDRPVILSTSEYANLSTLRYPPRVSERDSQIFPRDYPGL
jgi:hypothetical protein